LHNHLLTILHDDGDGDDYDDADYDGDDDWGTLE
jgi:hypothetical protein